MRSQITASIRAGERVTRTAERVLDADRLRVSVPQHVEELEGAARAAALGDPEAGREFRRVVDRWRSRVERLGQAGGTEAPHGDFTVRTATEQLVRDIDGATDAQVTRAVERWVLERATHHARMTARHETAQAYRASYETSLAEVDGVMGYRWDLSPRHPRPDVCFPAGTRVLMADRSWRAIEAVVVGEMVIADDGTARAVLRTMQTAYRGDFVTVRAALPTGEVIEATATGTHPFAAEHGWRRADALRTGDLVRAIPCPPPGGARSRREGGIGDRGSPCSLADAPPAHWPRGEQAPHDAGTEPSSCRSARSAPLEGETRPLSGLASVVAPCVLHASSDSAARSSTNESPRIDALRHQDRGRGEGCCTPSSADTSSSSTSWDVRAGRTPHRTTDTSHAGTSPSSKPGSASSGRIACCTSGTPALRGAPAEAGRLDGSRQRTCASRTAFQDADRVGPPPSQVPSSEVAPDTSRSGEWVDSTRHPWAVLIGIESTVVNGTLDVFNLEVDSAHTYIAEGFVVHNCDLYANQDLFGLGPGGYPAAQVPGTPHPSCLCTQTAILDRFALRRELAIARGEAEPPRDWESGRRETGAEWLARQPEGFRNKLLGPTRARIFRDEPGRVLTPRGEPVPVHQVLGQPAPTRSAGRTIQTAPLVRAERAVRPTPPLGQ